MTKREWENEQIEKMMEEIRNEPLCNILLYASCYLLQGNGLMYGPRQQDIKNADTLKKYSDILAKRSRESY